MSLDAILEKEILRPLDNEFLMKMVYRKGLVFKEYDKLKKNRYTQNSAT